MNEYIDDGGNSKFFNEEQRAWSQRKLRILTKYVDSWAKKRGSAHSEIYYVDGFAGRGVNGHGDAAMEGSPVQVARIAQAIRDEGKSRRLICMNSELEPARCANLKKVLAFADPDVVTTFCGQFNDHLPTMLGRMKQSPALFFLDPWGVVGIAPDELKPVVERRDTEILLTFSLPTVFRLSGSSHSEALEASGKVARLTRLLGEDPDNPNPEWMQKKAHLSTDDWAEWVIRTYMDQIRRLNRDLNYGLAYPIKEKMVSGTKYYLLLATRSLDAFPLMSDFICSEEDNMSLEAEMERRTGGQMSLFAPARETNREDRFPTVIEEIHEFGMNRQGCTRKAIIESVALRHLGEFKQKHIRYMVDQLVEQGRASFYDGPDRHKQKDLRPITFY